MENSKKVAIHGSYYGKNFGDTLLIRLMCDHVSRIVGKENVYLAVEGLESEQNEIGYPLVTSEIQPYVNYVILGGGGYYGEPNTSFIKKIKWVFRNFKRHILWIPKYKRAHIGAFGVGFGPLSILIHRKVVSRLFNKYLSYAIFRDQESLDFALKYGIKTNEIKVDKCVDLALSLPVHKDKEKIVIFHLHNLKEALVREIITLVNSDHHYSNVIYQYVILYDNPSQENLKSKKFYADLFTRLNINNYSIYTYKDHYTTLDIIKSSEVVITNKLHVGIVGIATGSKVISLPTHQKTARLYRQLDLATYCMPSHLFSSSEFSNKLRLLEKWSLDRSIIENGINRLYHHISSFLRK